MKKISLKNLNLKEVEQLSREQLKSVLGGWSEGTGGTDNQTDNTSGCWSSCVPDSPVRYECTRGDCLTIAGDGVWCRGNRLHTC